MEHPERYPQLTIRVERVEVLPFHKLGAPKYEELGLEFALADTPTPSPELVRATRERFRAHGLAVY
jgi:pyruvate formate lyase activating enzyme